MHAMGHLNLQVEQQGTPIAETPIEFDNKNPRTITFDQNNIQDHCSNSSRRFLSSLLKHTGIEYEPDELEATL